MIQRIQSLWLFLASMINGALFISPLYSYTLTDKTVHPEGILNFYPLLLVAIVITVLPLITIFMFNNRPRQRGMAVMSIIGGAGFLTLMLMHAANVKAHLAGTLTTMDYVIPGAVLPVLSLIPLILAIAGIRKDEKLIKSLDRLR